MSAGETLRPAAFLDRDGVIGELVPDPVSGLPESPLRVADVRLMPSAADGLRALRAAGFLLVGVSNQPAAAKGKVSEAEIAAVQRRVVALLAAEAVELDAFELCLHHPDGIVPALTGRCDCRKPAPGMLLAAAAELAIDLERSWMLGDTDSDVRAGTAAGCRTVLVEHPGSAHKRSGAAAPDLVASDLGGAAAAILSVQALSSGR